MKRLKGFEMSGAMDAILHKQKKTEESVWIFNGQELIHALEKIKLVLRIKPPK